MLMGLITVISGIALSYFKGRKAGKNEEKAKQSGALLKIRKETSKSNDDISNLTDDDLNKLL